MQIENNIIYGGPITPNITDDTRSLGEYCLKKLSDKGNGIALIDGITNEIVTAADILAKCVRIAECLRYFGIKSGDKIGLSSENAILFPCIQYATFFVGGCIAPVNPMYTEGEIVHAFNLSRPKIVFASQTSMNVVIAAMSQCPFVEKVIIFGPKVDDILKNMKNVNNNFIISYNEFINNHNVKTSSQKFICEPTDNDNHVAVIVCSSGTTGLPKGVELTETNVIVTLSQSADRAKLIEGSKISVGILPWFHVYGCFSTLSLLLLPDSEMILLPKFVDHIFLKCIQKYKATFLLLAPPIMVFLAKSPLVDQYDLSSLKLISSGAAPLGKEIQQAVSVRLKVDTVQQGYGMSEGTLTFLGQTSDYNKPGSVGIVRPGLWAKVIGTETGKALPAFEHGEICFKGVVIMKGYIGDSASTRNAIDKDGWLHTGDIGYYDDDGEFFIVDRIKELIKYKGFQVPPAELEAILLTNPMIKDAAVIGVPDEKSGELPMAFVVKYENANINEQIVMDFVAERTSNAKRLRGGVLFINEIPKNLSGKILRRELRAELLKNKKSKL